MTGAAYRRTLAGIMLAAVLALPAPPSAADVPLPDVPRGRGEQCVEPSDVMRRDHMEFLVHQRDRTVHDGIRTKRHSLIECIACHAMRGEDGGYVAVNAPGQFCAGCHAYAGVKIDCFQCHAAVPAGESARSGERARGTAVPLVAVGRADAVDGRLPAAARR